MELLRRNARRPFVVMPLVAVLALGGWIAFKPDTGGTTGAPPAGRTIAATQGTMARTVSAQGTVAAAETSDLSFSSSGTVTAVNVKAGQKVVAGDVLATIDSAALQSAVVAAEADVASAKAALSDHTSAGGSSAQLAADRSTVTSAEDELTQAQTALDGAELVAAFDGTVASVDLTVGEELGSSGSGGTSTTGSQSGSGRTSGDLGSASANGGNGSTGSTGSSSTPQIQLVSTDSYTVELGVDDNDIAQVAVGQAASITLSTSSSTTGRGGFGGFGGPGGAVFGAPGAVPGGAQAAGNGQSTTDTTVASAIAGTAAATGKVTEVGQIADASSGVASYPVTVAFTDDTGDYNVGATVQVDVTIAEVQDVVQVPTLAVTTTDAGSTVTVSTDGKESTRAVTTGLTSGGFVEIKTGLKAGELVVLTFPGRGAQGRAS